MNRILFVCTGNTCRSPMAEGILRRMLEDQGLQHVEVRSAGVAAMDGTPVSGLAAAILQQRGFTHALSSASLTEELLEWADLVLTMTSNHKQHTLQRFPEFVDKVHTLKEFVDDDPATAERLAELEKRIADVQVKRALSETVTNEEMARIHALQRELPDYDLADPFGGPLEVYKKCADEIESCLIKLINKLKS
jgi:protein-tyrosine-phosphatase